MRRELPELRARLKRVGDAMARAVEAAHRVGVTLEMAHRELRAELKPEHRRTLDDFAALAGAGAGALIEQAVEPQLRAEAERVIAAYEALAAAAAAAPRMREMREYLRATALIPDIAGDIEGDDAAVDKAVVAVADRMPAIAGRDRRRGAALGAAQLRCARGTFPKIQMELHTNVPGRA
jgi:hypothetical protein